MCTVKRPMEISAGFAWTQFSLFKLFLLTFDCDPTWLFGLCWEEVPGMLSEWLLVTAAPVDALLGCERTDSDAFDSGLGLLLLPLFPSVSSTASQGSPAATGTVCAVPPDTWDTSSLSALRFVSGSRSSQSKRLMLEDSITAGCWAGGLGAREAAPAWEESRSVLAGLPFFKYSEVLAILSNSLAISGSTVGCGKTMAVAGWMGGKAMKGVCCAARGMKGDMVGVKPFWNVPGLGNGAEGNNGVGWWVGVDTLELDGVDITGVHWLLWKGEELQTWPPG